jgi:glutamate carboxypeptidase
MNEDAGTALVVVHAQPPDPIDDALDLPRPILPGDRRAEANDRVTTRLTLAVPGSPPADRDLDLDHRRQPVDVRSLEESDLDQAHGPPRIPRASARRLAIVEIVEAPGSEVTADELAQLEAAVREAEPAFLADLERLVNIDCGSYTPDGVDEVGRFVAGFLADLGGAVEALPDPARKFGSTIVGRVDGDPGGRRVVMVGHMDTVFDPGTAAARPFRIEDGRGLGPGVSDMKSGLLAGLYALRALRDVTGGSLPFERLTFFANPDEEVGSPTSTPHILEAARDADLALMMECARANGNIVSSRKGILDARISITGRAAHAGVEPEKGRSAILAAADLVQRLHLLNGRWDGVTVNVGVIRGGTRPNVVAEQCDLEVDVRAVGRDELEEVEDEIQAMIRSLSVQDTTAEMTELHRWWPMEKLARSGRLATTAIALGDRMGMTFEDQATGGAGDANTTAGLGVPSLDGLGPVGGLDHSPDEFVEMASIVPRTALLAALLLAISRDAVIRSWREDASA